MSIIETWENSEKQKRRKRNSIHIKNFFLFFPNCPQDWLSQKCLSWNIRPLMIRSVYCLNVIFHHSHIGTICFNRNELFFSKQSMLPCKSLHLHTSFSLLVTVGPSLLHLANCIHPSGFGLDITSFRKLSLTPGIGCTSLVSNSSLCLFLSNHSLHVDFF